MKPNEHDPRGYKVVYFDERYEGYVTCFNSYRYKQAKLYKDMRTANEQRWGKRPRYYILPMRKKDREIWKKTPF